MTGPNGTRRAALVLIATLVPALAGAQRYRVYEWETPMDGWAEPTLQTYVVAKSDQTYDHFGRSVTEQGVSAHTLELEYGLTDRATAGVYADFDAAPGLGLEYARARGVFRYRFSNRYQRVFDPAVYVEYYVPRGKYQEGNQLEVRGILEHDFEDLRLDLNPIVAYRLGVDTAKVQGELDTGLYWRRFYHVQPGVELYSRFGALGSSPSVKEQQHVLFPSATLRFAGVWTWNLGVGFGLTSKSDRVTAKSVLSYQFPTIRPSEQAH